MYGKLREFKNSMFLLHIKIVQNNKVKLSNQIKDTKKKCSKPCST